MTEESNVYDSRNIVINLNELTLKAIQIFGINFEHEEPWFCDYSKDNKHQFDTWLENEVSSCIDKDKYIFTECTMEDIHEDIHHKMREIVFEKMTSTNIEMVKLGIYKKYAADHEDNPNLQD